MGKILHLSETTINRIAAGEVVERPSSVVKELVENALDAGATKIEIILEQAGKNLISVTDNGCGIDKDDLLVAIQRHTTSKLNEDDIMNISSFGFRGEALPSIGSVSRMEIISRTKSADSAYGVYVEGGATKDVKQALLNQGTKVSIRDLFFATPARLKFLRSDRSELSNSIDIVRKISMANPSCEFTLVHNDKNLLKLEPADDLKQRITDIIGEDFVRNSINLSAQREDIEIVGFTSLPTYNRATSEDQFLFINNRPVKDKLLNAALRVAYLDVLSRDRFPVSVIFINTDPYFVDVNVHPAKTEVRFRDSNLMRGLLISSIKDALYRDGGQVSDTVGTNILNSFTSDQPVNLENSEANRNFHRISMQPYMASTPSYSNFFSKELFNTSPEVRSMQEERVPIETAAPSVFPLGAACAQLHETYIISQTPDSIIITDQHAAHERLTYEKLKAEIANGPVHTQRLLIPEIIELPDEKRGNLLLEKSSELAKYGLIIEVFSTKSVIVTEVPQIIGNSNIGQLINDIADDLLELGEDASLTMLMEHVLETYACHHSIRAGRKLSIVEMNHLLRDMESTAFSGQCNHGRPTYITLKLKDVEKLFGRT
jgi:DNA mismatch repair protein MutL